MQEYLRSLFMKAAKRPVAGAAVMLLALLGAMLAGVGLGSCQMLGAGKRDGAAARTRGAPGEDAAAAEIYRVAGISGEPEMRVRIGVALVEARFESDAAGGGSGGGVEGFWVGPAGVVRRGGSGVGGGGGGAELLRPPLVVGAQETAWVVRDGRGTERRWRLDQDLEVSAVTNRTGEAGWVTIRRTLASGEPDRAEGWKYAGIFRLHAPRPSAPPSADVAAAPGASPAVLAVAQPGGETGSEADRLPVAFDIIEHVMMEQYIPGVLALELPNSWSLGAFKVQAVAARSYAIHQRQRSVAAGRKFDVESSTQDQVYKGAVTLPVAVEAARQTRGMVLEHGGAVLRAYYSSTCGGRAASARDTWPISRGFEFNLASPLQGQERRFACEGSPLYRWRVERPRAELVKRLQTFGQRNTLLVRDLKDLFRIEVLKTNDTGRPSEYKIIEPGGRWFTLSAEQLRLACNTDYPGSGSLPASAPITRQTRVNSGDLEFVVQGSTVVITGRGFGHGVGMCQYCAQAFGSRGEDAVALLEMFYPGARVVRAY